MLPEKDSIAISEGFHWGGDEMVIFDMSVAGDSHRLPKPVRLGLGDDRDRDIDHRKSCSIGGVGVDDPMYIRARLQNLRPQISGDRRAEAPFNYLQVHIQNDHIFG